MKKAALITGASSGIGAATARLFGERGYFVYLLGRNAERLEEVALSCPSGASLFKCDLNNEAQLQKYTQHLAERPDTSLEVLVNNAGIFQRHAFAEGGLQVWQEQFATNLFGSINLTQRILPYLIRHRGSIVNVSSTLGLRPSAGTSAYSATKAAMINWTQSLALELGSQGVRVNCVCPGLVETPIHGLEKLSPADREHKISQLNTLQPLGRLGRPEEIAEAIYFLASAQSSWTTAAVLSVDGGINIGK